MSAGRPAIDTCVVLHTPSQALPLLRRVASIGRMSNSRIRAALMLTSSGDVDEQAVRANCMAVGIEIVECRRVEDWFFDFSAYAEAARYFAAAGSQGVLFVNDTLVSKHDSALLHRLMARTVANTYSRRYGFPLLLGPYRHSEFSFDDGSFDEFVSTFMFHLNAPALKLLIEIVDELPAVLEALRVIGPPDTHLEPALLRFCRVHALQLEARYSAMARGDDLLLRKLATSYGERALSRRAKASGTVWYVASGLTARLLVPIQAAMSRMRHRLIG